MSHCDIAMCCKELIKSGISLKVTEPVEVTLSEIPVMIF